MTSTTDRGGDYSPETLTRELATEQAHVTLVYAHLRVAADAARRMERDGQNRFHTDRADFLREEHGTALFERDAFSFQAARRLATLDAEYEGLVFGRLDLINGETRYIGRLGVRDDDYEPLVIDWRAPAAEPFYRATATTPLDVVRRRVLRTHGETVIGIEDDLLDAAHRRDLPIIGEGALMAALSRARGNRMRDIVATIQAEQDQAIRAPYQGVTIISGGPGTGKTVVALHRAAFLLYSHRKRMEKGGVLVVGPSALFMNYIERVLPSLGEDSVTLRSIGQVAGDVLGVEGEHDDPKEAAGIKGSLRMLPVLRRLVAEPPASDAQQPLRVTVRGDVLVLDPARLARIRHDVLAAHQYNEGRRAGIQALLNALWARWSGGSYGSGTDAGDDFGNDSGMDREQFDDYITTEASWRLFIAAWWPPVTPQQALARLADRDVLESVAGDLLSRSELRILAGSIPANAASDDRTHAPSFTPADIALLDELAHLLGPLPHDENDEPEVFIEGGESQELVTMADILTDRRDADPDATPIDTFAHVLVDEAQDVTPMQWRMLRRRGPQASWTIVGDLAQSSWPDIAETAQAVRELVGGAPRRTFQLTTNYRSPAEVFDLASQVITRAVPDAALPHAVRRTGVLPRLLAADPDSWIDLLAEEIHQLADEVEGTIGVICPPSLLPEIADRSVLPGADALADRLSIMSPLQAKGLEFDATVVVAPDRIVAETGGGVRVLYVALTRPTQRLVTIDVTLGAAPGVWRESLEWPPNDSE